jgi:ribose/xylose/arabinose/galactoside ABC-type transport system permease subunit
MNALPNRALASGTPRRSRRPVASVLGQFNFIFYARAVGIIAVVAFAAAAPGFATKPSLVSLVTTVSFVGCIAVGTTLITIGGNIMSFSLAATLAASTVIFTGLFNAAGLLAAILITLASAAVLSGAQGLLIGVFGANPIIVTIAASALIGGIAQWATNGLSIFAVRSGDATWITGVVLGIPTEFLAFLLVALIGQLLLSFTVFGRNLYMIGNSLPAAEIVGIYPWRTVLGSFLWAGLFAGVSGIIVAARYGYGNMEFGEGYDYAAIAAVLVGGTAIQGGEGAVYRTVVGTLFIALIQALLLLYGLHQEWQYLITGVIVLVAIMLQAGTQADGSR